MSKLCTISNKVCKSNNIAFKLVDPLNPLDLPANTVRVRTNDGNPPIKTSSTTYDTATLVDGTNDVYDVYKHDNNFVNLLFRSDNVVEVLGANTTNVSAMTYMLGWCSALSSVALFDTSNSRATDAMFALCRPLSSVPDFNTSNSWAFNGMFDGCSSLTSAPNLDTRKAEIADSMFNGCSSLTAVPLYDMPYVTDVDSMFNECVNVQSGALELYSRLSALDIETHENTFYNCGVNTVQGAAELAQIPDDWK